jgi:hypothetical protein
MTVWIFHVFRQAWKHWLFTEEIQEAVGDECIPFHVWDVSASSPHAKYEGRAAKMVAVAKRKISLEPNEVVVSVVHKGRAMQISIEPSLLIPWTLVEGSKVVVNGYHWIGQVGKLVELNDGGCAVETASSGEISYFSKADIVIVVKK